MSEGYLKVAKEIEADGREEGRLEGRMLFFVSINRMYSAWKTVESNLTNQLRSMV